MAIDPSQLLELARREAEGAGTGAPRQVDLRRAVSTAYYALFHALCAEIAAAFTGSGNWNSAMIRFYRALDHGSAKTACQKLAMSPLHPDLQRDFGLEEFDPGLRTFATTFVSLQELRHACDYDPSFKIGKDRALAAVAEPARTRQGLVDADPGQKRDFLAYLARKGR